MPHPIAPRDSLTDMQRAFVIAYVNGSNIRQAVVDAGFSEASAPAIGTQLLRTPHVLSAIHYEVRKSLITDAPLAARVLRDIAAGTLKDPNGGETPLKLRLEAAKTLLDRAGHIAPRAIADKTGAELSLHEMSVADLRSLADKLQDEIAGRAKDVSSADIETAPMQSIDIVG